jgi:hypothetical protein
MGDLTIDTDEHRYFTNGILSHNTINSAIAILYYCVFEYKKNIMIGANISATAEDILLKIKDVYYLLPFWLKPSVKVWSVKQITFGDTKCRIKTTATTRTAAIGNTIDMLFLDEFAHVPGNIAGDYYKSIYPTVSSIKNSKIIITSTPNGYNKFWELLDGAEKPLGAEGKNTFVPKRVYWHQVPGRFVTYLRLNDYAIEKNGLSNLDVYEWVKNMGFAEETLDSKGFLEKEGLKMVMNYDTGKTEIHIPNKDSYLPVFIKNILDDKEWENPLSDYFRGLFVEKGDIRVRLLDLCTISSWKEDAISDIGSLASFLQEYDLQFLSGAKMVLDTATLSRIEKKLFPFEYEDLPVITQRSYVPYDDLKWIKGQEEIFNINKIKDYYMSVGVDISEGLNGDYSVINFFRLMVKDESEWGSNITSIYDFFKLVQVGLYHNNRTSVQDLGELLYLLAFEVCNEDKIGINIEANNWGNELTNSAKNMYQGRNKYSSHVFYRYKHSIENPKLEIGIKLRSQKNDLVKKYQKAIRQEDIVIHEHKTLLEMTKFIKKDNNNGSYSFQADAGAKDDITMTLIEQSAVFETNLYKDLVSRYMSELPHDIKLKIEQRLKLAPVLEATNYEALFIAKSKAMNVRKANINTNPYSNNPYMGNNGGNNNPYMGGNNNLRW